MPKIPVKTVTSTVYIGIDPGKKGGLVFLDGSEVHYQPMPTTERDLWTLIGYIEADAKAVVEHVTTSPQMGVVSAGTFMYGYGQLRMALTAAGIPYEPTRPQVWQKYLQIPPKNKKKENDRQFKERLRAKAQQLFPKLPIWTEPKSVGKQLAICDALLIAEYCRRIHS